MNRNRLLELAGVQLNEAADDDIHTKAVDLMDDMLSNLNQQAQYGEQGDIIRYIVSKLQGQGH